MDALRALGEDVWFNLGDQDLAICLPRARRLADGARLTECCDALRRALGVRRACCRWPTAGAHARARAGRVARVQAFMIRERARRARRGRRVTRRRAGRADARGARGDRGAPARS